MSENKVAVNNRNKLIVESQVRRLNLIQRYKESVGCSQCGEQDVRCLDLHHIDPKTKNKKLKKDRSRGGMQGLSYKEIVNEIMLCIVLCSNCHRKRETKLRKLLN